MRRLVLNTFFALSTSASVTLKHRRILGKGERKDGEERGRMERREGGGRGREGGGARITDLHTQCNHIPGHLPLILQVEEEVLNCQSICHNIDAPKQRGLQWRCGGVEVWRGG